MKLLLDFFPLILFFGAYKAWGIYVATLIAILASGLQVGVLWWRRRRVEVMHLVTLGVIAVFGGMTLLLKDDVFIKWKPTIVNWIFAGVLLVSQWFSPKPAIQWLLGSRLEMPAPVWRNVNLAWALFFLFMGILNLYVAFYFRTDLDPAERTDLWVNFKVFWMMGLTLVFAIAQSLYLMRHVQPPEEERS